MCCLIRLTDLVSEGILKIEQRNKNFLYFDPTDVLCKDKSECAVYKDKRFITTDGVHFSNSASIELYTELMNKLKLHSHLLLHVYLILGSKISIV